MPTPKPPFRPGFRAVARVAEGYSITAAARTSNSRRTLATKGDGDRASPLCSEPGWLEGDAATGRTSYSKPLVVTERVGDRCPKALSSPAGNASPPAPPRCPVGVNSREVPYRDVSLPDVLSADGVRDRGGPSPPRAKRGKRPAMAPDGNGQAGEVLPRCTTPPLYHPLRPPKQSLPWEHHNPTFSQYLQHGEHTWRRGRLYTPFSIGEGGFLATPSAPRNTPPLGPTTGGGAPGGGGGGGRGPAPPAPS